MQIAGGQRPEFNKRELQRRKTKFHRAQPGGRYSCGVSMKIAYLILGHAYPEHIIRIIQTLRPTSAVFVVHVDERSDPSVMQALETYAGSCDDVVFAKRHRCYWGTYSLMEATFACIQVALEQTRPFDYGMLLSGQDYPIKNAAETAAFFERNAGMEFIEAFPLAKHNRWTEMAGPFQAMDKVTHWHLSLRSRRFHIRIRRSFYNGWEPQGGSQWWCLSRAALAWMWSYVRQHPAIVRYFRFVFIPDESMVQTLVANSPFRDKIAQDLHYIDWERPNPGSPRTLDDEDFDRLASSSRLMARKLHPEKSSRLLDRIDRELLKL